MSEGTISKRVITVIPETTGIFRYDYDYNPRHKHSINSGYNPKQDDEVIIPQNGICTVSLREEVQTGASSDLTGVFEYERRIDNTSGSVDIIIDNWFTDGPAKMDPYDRNQNDFVQILLT